MEDDVIEFLQHSNYIENEPSLQALDDAIKAWKYFVKQPKLTVKNILKSHKIMAKTRTTLPEEAKGNYRKIAVWVGGREGKPWYVIPKMMDQLIVNMNDLVENGKNDNSIYLERTIKEQHIKFETIHPFQDINGRIGRLIFLWQYVKLELPIKIIHEGKEQMEYYKWFPK